MSEGPVDLVVVGAGIAGLTIAADAAAAGRTVIALEAADRAGGLLRRGELDGIPLDLGAESFATRTTGVAELISDLSLDLQIVSPAPGGAHLVVAGADGETDVVRAPLPKRTVLGIPADPLADDVVGIIGPDAAARAAAEPRRDAPITPEPSLLDLAAAQCGDVLARRLVDSLCRSVYSLPASEARLSRLHPALWREFCARGSLIEAAGAVAAPTRAGAAVAGIAGGMWRLAEAVADTARANGADIRLRTPVTAVEADATGVVVTTADGTLRASRVVVATGSSAARALLGGGGSTGGGDPTAPAVRVVAALVDSADLDEHPVGSGAIVGADVPTAAKALTHVDAKWPWMAAALSGSRHVVRLSARDADAPGLDSAADVAREISLLTGVEVAADQVVAVTSARWADAVAARPIDADRERDLATHGILLAGAAVAGTGLASVVPHARSVARALLGAGPDHTTPITTFHTRRTA